MASWFHIRKLGPALIALAMVAEIGLRFAPPEWIWFRPWEAAMALPSGDGRFQPDFAYDNPRAYGDLANMGNCEACRVYRRETFTTDAYGFRNKDIKQPVAAVLTGDSYGVGSGLNDEETLSAQLGGRIGTVYNAAGALADWPATKEVIRRLNLRGGLVIWEQAELHPFPSLPLEPATPRALQLAYRFVSREASAPVRSALRRASLTFGYSPLRTVTARFLRRFEDGRLLPNASEANVVKARLTTGTEMLFYRSEVAAFARHKPFQAAFFDELAEEVHKTGNELIVVFIPTKYSVYSPLLTKPPMQANEPFSEAVAALKARGIMVLDLTEPLREQAHDLLAGGATNYHLDDTHWNAIGAQLGAEEIARLIERRRPKY